MRPLTVTLARSIWFIRTRSGRNEILAYDVPIPGGATGALTVSITLAVTSPVELSQVTEYTRSSVELTMRPNARRYSFTRADPEK